MGSRCVDLVVEVQHLQIPDCQQTEIHLQEHLDQLPRNVYGEAKYQQENAYDSLMLLLVIYLLRSQILGILALDNVLEVYELEGDIDDSDC